MLIFHVHYHKKAVNLSSYSNTYRRNGNILTKSFKHGIVKVNVLRLRDNIFYDIQRYVSDKRPMTSFQEGKTDKEM
jgi:hypothetical protein